MGVVNTMEDVDELLSIIDPHNNKQMTYSETVQLLSSVIFHNVVNTYNSKWYQ